METIQNDAVVQFAYTLNVEGQEMESNLLDYMHGHGNIIPGLENELTGRILETGNMFWSKQQMLTVNLTPTW